MDRTVTVRWYGIARRDRSSRAEVGTYDAIRVAECSMESETWVNLKGPLVIDEEPVKERG